MREYKFRAWDKTREEMINVDMLLNTENGMKQYRVTRPMVNGCLDVEFVKEDTILMQYTGLKDKNGVEIYEGDIIKAKDYLTKDNKTYFDDVGIVEFKDGMFMICDDFPSSFKGQIIEVIGNIYENQELLN